MCRFRFSLLAAVLLLGCSSGGPDITTALSTAPAGKEEPRQPPPPASLPAAEQRQLAAEVEKLFKEKGPSTEELRDMEDYEQGLRKYDRRHRREHLKFVGGFENALGEFLAMDKRLRELAKGIRGTEFTKWYEGAGKKPGFHGRLAVINAYLSKLVPRGDESWLIGNYNELHEILKIHLPDHARTNWERPETNEFGDYVQRCRDLLAEIKGYLRSLDEPYRPGAAAPAYFGPHPPKPGEGYIPYRPSPAQGGRPAKQATR